MVLVSTRCNFSHCFSRASFFAAFGTSHSLYNVSELGFPTGKGSESVWVAAGASQKDDVLPEIVAEFVYNWILHIDTVQKPSDAIKSN
jgi:hypothetical protein